MDVIMDIPCSDEFNCAAKFQERWCRLNYPVFWRFLNESYPKDLTWSEKLYWYFHCIYDYPVCPVCGKVRLKYDDYTRGYRVTCRKCVGLAESTQNKKKQTLLKNYGVDNPMDSDEIKNKIKKTNLERYGVENPFASDEIKKKIKESNLERYGVEWSCQAESVKQKKIQTNLRKYGVEFYSQTKESKDRIKETHLKKYGVEHMFQSPEIKERIRQTNIRKYGVPNPIVLPEYRRNKLEANFKKALKNHPDLLGKTDDWQWICKCPHPDTCNKCSEKIYLTSNNEYNSRKTRGIELCTKLAPKGDIDSSYEKITRQWLDELGIKYEKGNRKILKGKELDIYIPSHKIAIEINGSFWHCFEEKGAEYHRSKYIECSDQGIVLLSFWEDWFRNNPDLLKDTLKKNLGMYDKEINVEDCEVHRINDPELKDFLKENSLFPIQDYEKKVCLTYEGEVVYVATFSRDKEDTGVFHVSNICEKKGYHVRNGALEIITDTPGADVSKGEIKEILCSFHNDVDSRYINEIRSLNFDFSEIPDMWPQWITYNCKKRSYEELNKSNMICDSGITTIILPIK